MDFFVYKLAGRSCDTNSEVSVKYYLVACNAQEFGVSPKFRRKILPPSFKVGERNMEEASRVRWLSVICRRENIRYNEFSSGC